MHGALGFGKGASAIVCKRGSSVGAGGSGLCAVFSILSCQRPRLSSTSVPEKGETVPQEQCGDMEKKITLQLYHNYSAVSTAMFLTFQIVLYPFRLCLFCA